MRLAFAPEDDEVKGRKVNVKKNKKKSKQQEEEGRLGRLRHTDDILDEGDGDEVVYWSTGMIHSFPLSDPT